MGRNDLHLHHEITLLALHDEKGTTHTSTSYAYALGGALLAELLLHERIRVVEPKKKKKLVELVSPKGLGDEILDEALERIRSAKRRGSPQTWVSRLSGIKRLKHRSAEELCRRGILRADEDKVLLIFKRKLYPEVDPKPERAIMTRLHEAIFTQKSDIDPRTVVLTSLADAAGILPKVFDKKELKPRKARIKSLVEGDAMGQATKEAIQAAQAAQIATSVAVTTAAT